MTSRRELLRSAAALLPFALGNPQLGLRSSRRSATRVVVVGAGAFGGWTALKLAERGAAVTLIDAWGAGNVRASSGGETRVIRGVYNGQRVCIDMVRRASWYVRHVHARAEYVAARSSVTPITNERMTHVALSDGTRREADAFVFACGPWLGTLFRMFLDHASGRPNRTCCISGQWRAMCSSRRGRCRFG